MGKRAVTMIMTILMLAGVGLPAFADIQTAKSPHILAESTLVAFTVATAIRVDMVAMCNSDVRTVSHISHRNDLSKSRREWGVHCFDAERLALKG